MINNFYNGYNPYNDFGIESQLDLSKLKINKDNSVLIIGSGTGDDAFSIRNLVGENGRVIGIDLSANMLAISRQNCGNFGFNNVTFFKREIDKLLFNDSVFDVVVCSYYLNMLEDYENVFRELRRVLKADGTLYVKDILPHKQIESITLLNPSIADDFGLFKNKNPMLQQDYFREIQKIGFTNVSIIEDNEVGTESGECLLFIESKNYETYISNNIILKRVLLEIKNK